MSVFIKSGLIRRLEGEEACAKARLKGQGKVILVREKSVKSQGISFQTKSGHPVA